MRGGEKDLRKFMVSVEKGFRLLVNLVVLR